ncbi:MAG: ATP-dependent RNA helicase HrpA, partial [Gammaproteobacteria bacterium]|nr:ATP-dependent RNA helicase HrpA [Gammaproteobacteria bacterium]
LAAQRRSLTPGARRRVVLATNVAETSITVPRVRVVVDTGVARISRYNRHTGVTRLPVEPVSRASADQRAGRCGRTGPGVCVRLYAKEDYSQRTPYTEAEILRSNLAAVLLRMRALGLKDLADFPFIDPPDKRHVNDGLRLLRELRALDDEDELTALGRRLARLPLEPRLGSMLLAAEAQDCVADILIIAAGLSVTDPRLRPAGREIAADAAHRRTADERSDFVSLLNLWDLYHDRTRGQSDDARHAFCRKRFLSLSRIREWQDVHDQLRQIAAEMGIRRGRRGATYARIHKALLAGLLRNIGFLNAEHEYTGVRGAAFRVAPGSAQHTARAKWIVAAEIVETSRLYAFTAARIRPEWVEAAAGDLIRKSYFDAHWDRKRGQCMVYEQCALYGLTIIPGRRRRYAPVSPAEARRIFIRSALVDDQIDSDAGFLAHNRAVLARLRGYEDRLRQPDVFISDDTLFEFYDHLVPGHVFDLQSFDRWNRDLDQDEFEALCLDHDALVARKLTGDMETRYPDRIELGGHQFELRYRFAPGAPDDGVTMLVPMELLADIDPRPVGWLVPGFLEEKASALMRSLPKAYRREIVPLNEVLEAFDPNGFVPGTSLGWALSEHLRRIRGVDVPDAEWDDGRLAPHLRMNFQVVGSDGTALEAGRDLARLQRRFARRKPDSAAESGRSAPDAAYTDWRFGDIPAQAETVRGARTVNLYPALEDHDDVVALSMAESPERARQMHRVGVRRLFLLSQQREIRRHVKREGQLDQLQLAYTLVDEPPPEWARRPAPRARSDNGGSLSREIVSLAATVALGNGSALDVRSEADFRALSEAGLTKFPDALSSVCGLCSDILDGYRGVRKLLAESRIPAKQESLDDVHGHLHGLVYRGFLNLTPVDQLRHYPRYLGALEKRIEKLREGGSRDSDKVAILAPLWRRFVARAGEHLARGRYDEELERYRWMMEEFRVSLFAQEVGTAHPVSTKRLDRQWAKVMP